MMIKVVNIIVLIGATLIAQLTFGYDAAGPVETQKIMMSAGWNLISIQVGDGEAGFAFTDLVVDLDSTSDGNFKIDRDVLVAVWGYDAATGKWQTYQPLVSGLPADPDPGRVLDKLVPGKGYWVKVAETTELTLTGIPWDGTIDIILSGWNLVGFPGLLRDELETVSLESIFREQLEIIQQGWTFEASSSQSFVGYDLTARPVLNELNTIKSGYGYWVFSTESMTLASEPAIILPPDSDLPPLSNTIDSVTGLPVRGDEDIDEDLNNNGVIDDPFTQDSIRFDFGVNRQIITLINRESGIVN